MKAISIINKIWSLFAILFIILDILDWIDTINIDNNVMQKLYFVLLILYAISIFMKKILKSQSLSEEVKKIHLLGVNENLLTYQYLLVRMVIVIVIDALFALQYLFEERDNIWSNSGLDLIDTTIFVVSFYCFVISICEVFCIIENKKLLKLRAMIVSDIDSQSVTEMEFIEMMNTNEDSYYIIKNCKTVFKVGVKVFLSQKDRSRYYYIEEPKGDCFEQIRYTSLDEFVQVIKQLNDNRETFDVVSKNEIIVPKK